MPALAGRTTPQKRLNVLRRVRPPSVIELIRDKAILANQAMISMASRCPPGQHARTKLRLLARCETSRFAPPLDQAMHPRAAHPEGRSDVLSVTTRIPRPGNPLPQIHR